MGFGQCSDFVVSFFPEILCVLHVLHTNVVESQPVGLKIGAFILNFDAGAVCQDGMVIFMARFENKKKNHKYIFRNIYIYPEMFI